MKLLNGTESAKFLGMTKQAFSDGAKSGRFTSAGLGNNGYPVYNPETIKKQYDETREAAEFQDHARDFPPGIRNGRPKAVKLNTEEAQKIRQSRLAKEVAQTKIALHKLQVMNGLYIEKAEAKRQGAELGELVMGVLQSWPSRLAPELAAMRDSDAHDFHQKLEDEVNTLIIAIRKKGGIDG